MYNDVELFVSSYTHFDLFCLSLGDTFSNDASSYDASSYDASSYDASSYDASSYDASSCDASSSSIDAFSSTDSSLSASYISAPGIGRLASTDRDASDTHPSSDAPSISSSVRHAARSTTPPVTVYSGDSPAQLGGISWSDILHSVESPEKLSVGSLPALHGDPSTKAEAVVGLDAKGIEVPLPSSPASFTRQDGDDLRSSLHADDASAQAQKRRRTDVEDEELMGSLAKRQRTTPGAAPRHPSSAPDPAHMPHTENTSAIGDKALRLYHDLPAAIIPTAILPNAIIPAAILPIAILPNAILPNTILPAAILPSTILPAAFRPAIAAGPSHNPQTGHLAQRSHKRQRDDSEEPEPLPLPLPKRRKQRKVGTGAAGLEHPSVDGHAEDGAAIQQGPIDDVFRSGYQSSVFICPYRSPFNAKQCTKEYDTSRNLQRHYTGVHGQAEAMAIQEGTLKEEDAVTAKYPWCHLRYYSCTLPSNKCKHYQKTKNPWTCMSWGRIERLVKRHKEDCHSSGDSKAGQKIIREINAETYHGSQRMTDVD